MHKPKAVANAPVGQVLAEPLFLKVKTKFHFTKSKYVINKSTRVIFGVAQLVILHYSRKKEYYDEVKNNRPPTHSKIIYAAQGNLMCKN